VQPKTPKKAITGIRERSLAKLSLAKSDLWGPPLSLVDCLFSDDTPSRVPGLGTEYQGAHVQSASCLAVLIPLESPYRWYSLPWRHPGARGTELAAKVPFVPVSVPTPRRLALGLPSIRFIDVSPFRAALLDRQIYSGNDPIALSRSNRQNCNRDWGLDNCLFSDTTLCQAYHYRQGFGSRW